MYILGEYDDDNDVCGTTLLTLTAALKSRSSRSIWQWQSYLNNPSGAPASRKADIECATNEHFVEALIYAKQLLWQVSPVARDTETSGQLSLRVANHLPQI